MESQNQTSLKRNIQIALAKSKTGNKTRASQTGNTPPIENDTNTQNQPSVNSLQSTDVRNRRDDSDRYCRICGERRLACLVKDKRICANCTMNEVREHIKVCPICSKRNVASEYHHIAHEKVNNWYGIQICCNCHQILTHRQVKVWKTNLHPIASILQGLYDVIMLHRESYKWSVPEFDKYTVLTMSQLIRHGFVAFGQEVGFTSWEKE